MWIVSKFDLNVDSKMSHINSVALRVLKRAQNMKQEDDGSVLIHKPAENNIKHEEAVRTADTALFANFTNKYGPLFSLNHSEKNGDVEPPASNGKWANLFANSSKSEKSNSKDPSKEPSARDRFRRAGMKARLARRMEKIVEDRMTIKQIFNRYVQNSTLHGFRFIFMQTFWIRRALWIILTCTMAAVFFMELRNSINLFFEYPFTTTSTTEYVPSLNFPAISICNLNNFEASKIKQSKLRTLYDKKMLPFEVNSKDPGYEIPGDELASILKSSSQTIDDLFQSCEWKSRDTAKTGVPNICGTQNFTVYSNLYGQTCYTFNSGHPGHPLLTLNETGLNMAFKLELDLKADESLRGLQEMGLKVVVHDQSETPLQQAGFVVSPGFQTFVEMRVRKTDNLKPPYATKCGEHDLNFFKQYRQSSCFLEQLSEEAKRKCQCKGDFMPDSSLRYCSLNETVTCLIPTVHRFDRKTNSECPVDCATVQYMTSLSYARFLSNPPIGMGLLRDGTSNYVNKLKAVMNPAHLRKYIEENIVVVQFFYQEMKEENVKQEPSYDFYKLVGDVGGQLGLMLGASVLTLVEFVDLFFFTLYHQLLRLSRKKKRENETNNNNTAVKT